MAELNVSEIEEEAFAVLDVFKENGDFFKLLEPFKVFVSTLDE